MGRWRAEASRRIRAREEAAELPHRGSGGTAPGEPPRPIGSPLGDLTPWGTARPAHEQAVLDRRAERRKVRRRMIYEERAGFLSPGHWRGYCHSLCRAALPRIAFALREWERTGESSWLREAELQFRMLNDQVEAEIGRVLISGWRKRGIKAPHERALMIWYETLSEYGLALPDKAVPVAPRRYDVPHWAEPWRKNES